MSNDDVFADIVNALLFDGKGIVNPNDLHEEKARKSYITDGELHETERDIVKRWMNGNIKIACIGIENQSKPDADMPLRVMAYDGADYRAQLLSSKGGDRYPVVTLVLYFGDEKHWNKPTTLKERLKIPDVLEPYVNDYKINLFEIAYLSDEQLQKFKSDFYAIVEYYIHMREKNVYKPTKRNFTHPWETVKMLSAISNDDRFEHAYHMVKKNEGEVTNMCELVDAFEKVGEIRGEKRGRENAKKEMAVILAEQGVSIDQIALAAGVSTETVEEWISTD